MPTKDELRAHFEKLKSILKKHERDCIVLQDTETDYYLNTRKFDGKHQPIFFAGVSVNKISVSFYLMPVYTFPELLDGLSPQLKTRKHGKSCFRFKTAEPSLLKELRTLARKSAERCKEQT